MATIITPYTLQGAISNQEVAYWDTVVAQSGTTLTAIDPGNLACSRVTVRFGRTVGAGLSEDVEMFSINFANDPGTGGAVNYLTDAMETLVEGWLDTMWTAVKAYCPTRVTLTGYDWRHWRADGPTGPDGRTKYAPLHKHTTRSVAGTAGGTPLPDQVAETVTWVTAARRHWGRIYLPSFSTSSVGTAGQILVGTTDGVAAAWHTLLASAWANADPITAVVLNQKNPGMLAVWKLQVDDTFDVQRRRRRKQTDYWKIYTS